MAQTVIFERQQSPDTFSDHTRPRIGILAKIDPDGRVNLSDRWAAPFVESGIDVLYLPVGTDKVGPLLDNIDALLLPGGDSHIHPMVYGDIDALSNHKDSTEDLERDLTAIRLIDAAYKRNIPTLGICRGMQEMVVAFHGKIKQLDMSQINHAQGYSAPIGQDGRRCPKAMDTPVHSIEIAEGGLFSKIFNDRTLMVNSIHEQGIDEALWNAFGNKRLRNAFFKEAVAPDGVIEAISAKERTFFLGVQAHFELRGPLHDALIGEFKKEIRAFHAKRSAGEGAGPAAAPA